MPAVFIEARQNLKNPPRIYTEIALEQLPDIIGFFEHDVPEAFLMAKDPRPGRRIPETNAAVIAALEELRAVAEDRPAAQLEWRFSHRRGHLPRRSSVRRDGGHARSTGCSRLATPICTAIRRNLSAWRKEIDPTKTPQEVLAELASIHPSPDQLLQTFHSTFDRSSASSAKKIITIPSTVQPALEETPPFMRATTQASMDSPGPFEKIPLRPIST